MKTLQPALGFTRTELLVVVVVLLVLALLSPEMFNVERKARQIACVNNLKRIGTAFRLWGSDHGHVNPMAMAATNGSALTQVAPGVVFPYFKVMSNELNTPRILFCPSDTGRTIATNFTSDLTDAKISYFVGLDADEANPQLLLTGDRNLTLNGLTGLRGLVTLPANAPVGWVRTNLHRSHGFVGLADGSAQAVTTAQFRQLLAGSGTNRLAIP